jgi:hypothetical protein
MGRLGRWKSSLEYCILGNGIVAHLARQQVGIGG